MHKLIIKINEINSILTRFKIVEITLDSIIILLAAFLILSYLEVKPSWTLFLPSAIYLSIAFKFKFNINSIKLVEERYPALKERLSTLYDNKEEANIVIEDLESSVLADMERVKYSSFISAKRLGIKVMTTVLLVFFILSTTIIGPVPSEPKDSLNTGNPVAGGKQNTMDGDSNPDIFNEPSSVRIGGDAEAILVRRGPGGELNIQGEGKQVSEYSRLFPPEASSSETYTETVPVIYQQIVKNYFVNLSR